MGDFIIMVHELSQLTSGKTPKFPNTKTIYMAPPAQALGKLQDEDFETKIASWPTEKGWLRDTIYQYQGFWFERPFLDGVIHAQYTFRPEPNDIILATFPKCGTTWSAALLYTTINRAHFDFSNHPFLRNSPQDALRWMEFLDQGSGSSSDLSMSPLVKTHTPYSLLPNTIKCASSVCPVIYVCRNPLDVFVSMWKFGNELKRNYHASPLRLDEAFDLYCKGTVCYGSYWDHVLGYWKASLERPDQVLFVKYEDMKTQPVNILKKLASFVGCPFSIEEEQNGVIEKIVYFCSFQSLASFQVNQIDTERKNYYGLLGVSNKSFFRKGKVGDHENFLTDEMVQHLKEITYAKFQNAGLDVFAS